MGTYMFMLLFVVHQSVGEDGAGNTPFNAIGILEEQVVCDVFVPLEKLDVVTYQDFTTKIWKSSLQDTFDTVAGICAMKPTNTTGRMRVNYWFAYRLYSKGHLLSQFTAKEELFPTNETLSEISSLIKTIEKPSSDFHKHYKAAVEGYMVTFITKLMRLEAYFSTKLFKPYLQVRPDSACFKLSFVVESEIETPHYLSTVPNEVQKGRCDIFFQNQNVDLSKPLQLSGTDQIPDDQNDALFQNVRYMNEPPQCSYFAFIERLGVRVFSVYKNQTVDYYDFNFMRGVCVKQEGTGYRFKNMYRLYKENSFLTEFSTVEQSYKTTNTSTLGEILKPAIEQSNTFHANNKEDILHGVGVVVDAHEIFFAYIKSNVFKTNAIPTPSYYKFSYIFRGFLKGLEKKEKYLSSSPLPVNDNVEAKYPGLFSQVKEENNDKDKGK